MVKEILTSINLLLINKDEREEEGERGLVGHLQPDIREPRRPEGVSIRPHHPKGTHPVRWQVLKTDRSSLLGFSPSG